MKKVILISRNDAVIRIFSSIEKSPSYDFEIMQNIGKIKGCQEALRYLDVTGSNQDQIIKKIDKLKQLGHPWAVVDPEGAIEDVGALFHQGACDYISMKNGKKLKVGRILKVLTFHNQIVYSAPLVTKETKVAPQKPIHKPDAPYAASWSHVKSGKTYTFCILYVELLPSREVSGKSGIDFQEQMQAAFQKLVTQEVGPYQGKVWMWNDWGGLVLLPCGNESCDTIIMAMRLLLNRVQFSIEAGPFSNLMDFRLALHIGVTNYKARGQTGTIVSDDINFIFHLGKKRIEPGFLYITDSYYPLLKNDMKLLFKDQGMFEGHRIYRMQSPFGTIN